MERNFNDKFEKFLKENADQYRLYPSERVWNGIYSALHSRRKWFGLGITLLLLTGGLITWLITETPKTTLTAVTAPAQESRQHSLSGFRPPATAAAVASNKRHAVELISISDANDLLRRSFLSEPPALSLPLEKYPDQSTNIAEPIDVQLTDELTDQDMTGTLPSQKMFEYPASWQGTNTFNWTIESVLNSYNRFRNGKRLTFQLNLTPTVSYRKLTENKSFLASATSTSYAPLVNDINTAVTHKPDLGLEFGLTGKYALASNFRATAGLQFNINRYDIKAFSSSFEVAKIALQGTSGVDSFYAVSTHRNFDGYKSDWLHNFYFEISMPVGVEVNIIGDDKVQFGVGGTIQPTYVLGDRAYLLSTDYKNYALVPWLIRHWNVSTGLETFVTYSTGKMKWQVGPQVRYQLLSSFADKYPVKENLFDFGLKVGVSLNK